MTTISSNPGILLIDKPKTWTSHDVVAKVRRLTGIKTVGHAGTLDPLATGLLIILVGKQYTKRQVEFLKMDKEYVCTAQLGKTTDSYDLDGTVTSRATWEDIKKISHEDLKKVSQPFVGEITQTVPAFSAVKIKGQKLYDLARKQQMAAVVLPQRQVKIYDLGITSFNLDQLSQTATFSISVKCSSGTYIRSLVHDIGQTLTVGACVKELRRTQIGPYSVQNAIKLLS